MSEVKDQKDLKQAGDVNAAFEQEMKALELEERKLRVQTLREDIATRQMNDQQKDDILRSRGQQLDDQKNTDLRRQGQCTHRKGGEGIDAIYTGGDDNDYAVWKIIWMTGEMLVRCLRCSKTWKPVSLDMFCEVKVKDGKTVPVAPKAPYTDLESAIEAFTTAQAEYKQACAFPTKNKPMRTTVYQFHTEAAKARYKQVMSNLDLR